MGFAQEQNNYSPEIVPPPPEATSLGKFVEMPVSYYTGTPTIQVPIYSIDLDGLKVPISLSYHAKGIKVSEIAPRVGIGWALNAGGSIMRQIRGPADDMAYGHLRTSYYKELFEKEDYRNLDKNIISSIINAEINEEVDLYPDLFIFNFLGYSGKFMFDSRTRLPILQEFSDLQIKPTFGMKGIERWTVVTPNGYTAYFEAADKEISSQNYRFKNAPKRITQNKFMDPISSWNLTLLVSPNGEKVEFKYAPENHRFVRRSYDIVEHLPTSAEVPLSNESSPSSSVISYYSKSSLEQHQLREIAFPLGRIRFVESKKQREDLQGSHVLDSIVIEDKDQKIIKSYKLNFSYSHNTSLQNVLNHIAALDPSASKRLFLDSIQEIVTTPRTNIQTVKPYYSFEYINKNKLPNRFSNAQDLWGYYNGKKNGKFLTIFGGYGYPNNRRVDTLKVQTGLLNKITFPTGGHALYEYESNRAIQPPYFEKLDYPDPNPISPLYQAGMLKGKSYWSGSDYRVPFEISENKEIASVFTVINVSNSENCLLAGSTDCQYDFYIEDKATQKAVVKIASGKTKISLNPGEYILVAKPTGKEDVDDFERSFFAFSIQWNYRVGGKMLYTSGNRIKKITLKDGKNNAITKRYEYKDPKGKCSGVVFSLPFYFYLDPIRGIEDASRIGYKNELDARPGSPICYHQGNHEGYSHVTEYQHSESEEAIKTSYKFTTIADGGKFYVKPHTLAIDNEWLRGKLLKKTLYKKINNSYVPIKEVINDYKYGSFMRYAGVGTVLAYEHSESKNYKISNPKTGHLIPLIIPADRSGVAGKYTFFFLTSGTQHLYSTTETTFVDGLSLSETTNFSYNYDKHYQKSESKTTTSSGKTITKKLYYPDDVTSTTALPGGGTLSNAEFQAIKQLQAPTESNPNGQHRIAEVVQEVTEVSDSKGSATFIKRNSYANWENKILPKSVQTLKGSASSGFEERAVYHRYDSSANPLEVSQKDGMHTVYLYGYSKQYPIAKIENATFKEVATALGVSEDALEDFNENHIGQINGLRSQKPEWMITTYTHIPLVGVKTITDPRGQRTNYEYDDFNRLKHIKDHNGDILEAYDYNYKK